MTRRAADGFTLIEMLIVIGVIGVLAVVLLPAILEGSEQAEVAETSARIETLAQSVASYERRHGAYPPDDFADLEGRPVAKDNGENSGIESLVWFLCQRRIGSDSIADHEDWLANTDRDAAADVIPELQRKDLMEVVDSWGAPLVYFSAQSSNYERQQRVRMPGEGAEAQRVKPVLNPRTGKPAAPRKFQLISAGPDGLFGTPDDITHPSFVGVQ